jgi:DNA-binding response OmpR family regulator
LTRVLVVEDDPSAAELLTVVMQRAGYEVSVVGTAVEALQAVANGIQLVLLDLGLPDMNGLQACAAMRALRPAIPIIVISARSSEPDLVLALDAGADDYLMKPFRTQELLARVRARLRSTDLADVLFAGDIAIDGASFSVTVHGQPLALTPKELEILTMLARSAGRLVPRHELLRNLWHTPLPAQSKSLDMHMSTLRRKLHEAGSAETITTVRGHGFRLSR